MSPVTYFADKAVVFAEKLPSADYFPVYRENKTGISRANILKILETHNSVAVITGDPDTVFAEFASEFKMVEAAGGVVVAPDGRKLMIYRNGRWDLPKGHIEPGENPEKCAIREICEETGVCMATPSRLLCDTLHCYTLRGSWEMKRTYWFLLSAETCNTAPQSEEGISEAVWCDERQVTENLKNTFPTIRRVMGYL